MIELLQHSPGVERIESQLLLRPHGTHTETLRNTGFQIYERLFMELELEPPRLPTSPADGRCSMSWSCGLGETAILLLPAT